MFIDRFGNQILMEEDLPIEVLVVEDFDPSDTITRDGFVIQESKKTNKTRFLEKNKYDPKTGTYETDIVGDDGKKLRVPLRIVNDRNAEDEMHYDVNTGQPKYVQLKRSTIKSKRWNSQATLKHEEGHIKDHMMNNNDRKIDADKLKIYNIMKKKGIDPKNIHGNAMSEIYADKYASDHTSKRSVIKMLDRLYSELSKAIKVDINRLKKIKTQKELVDFINDTDPQHRRYDDGKQRLAFSTEYIRDIIDTIENASLGDKITETATKMKSLEDDIKKGDELVKKFPAYASHFETVRQQYQDEIKQLNILYTKLTKSSKDDYRRSVILQQIRKVLIDSTNSLNRTLVKCLKDANARKKALNSLYTESASGFASEFDDMFIGEGYAVSESYRSIQSFLEGYYNVFQEEDESTKKKSNDEDLDDEEEEEIDPNDTDDQAEDEVSENVGDDDDMDLSDFGENGGDDLPNNEYDPKEVETLNALIASEAAALSEYMDASKESHVDVLRRLYSDIGDEERFHMEQLLFAKSELTGEEYIPRDKDVKKEYEELLAMGMDEESAMATAVDKMGIRVKVEDEDVDDVDIETLEKDVETLEACVFNTELLMTILEQAEENHDEALLNRVAVFTESYYQEEVMNAQTMPKKYKMPTNPVELLWKAFMGILNAVGNLIRNFKAWLSKSKMRRDRMKQWIEKNGIEGLFSAGLHLYLWNDAEGKFDFEDMSHFVNVLVALTKHCCKNANLDPKYSQTIDSLPIRPFKVYKSAYKKDLSAAEAANIINGVTFVKTKIVVTDQNKSFLTDMIFGFSENEMRIKFRPQPDDEHMYQSNNIYNRIQYLLDAVQYFGDETKKCLEGFRAMEGDQGSIYYSKRNLYNQDIKYLKAVIKGYSTITRCLTHDLNRLMRLSEGRFEETENADNERQNRPKNPNPNDLTKNPPSNDSNSNNAT